MYACKVSFDHEKARKDGIIIPHKGVNPSYDNALDEIGYITKQLDDYLQQQRKRLNCKVSQPCPLNPFNFSLYRI